MKKKLMVTLGQVMHYSADKLGEWGNKCDTQLFKY